MLTAFQTGGKCRHAKWETVREERVVDAFDPALLLGIRKVRKCVKCGLVIKTDPK